MEETNKELANSQSELKAAQNGILQKDEQLKELDKHLEELKCQRETLEKNMKGLDSEIGQFKSIHEEDVRQINRLQSQLTDKTSAIQQLEAHVKELEPLTEAVEQEKLRRIKVILLQYFRPFQLKN